MKINSDFQDITLSGGYQTIDTGGTFTVITATGYCASNAQIPAICGIQSGRYIRVHTDNAAYNNSVFRVYYYYV